MTNHFANLSDLKNAIRDYDAAKKAKVSNSVSEQAVNEAYDIAQALFDAIKPDLSEDPKLHSRISLIEKLHDAFENHEHSMLDRCLEELDTCDLTAQERQPLKTIFDHFDVSLSLADSEVLNSSAAAASSSSASPRAHRPPRSPKTPKTTVAPLSPALNGHRSSSNTIDTSLPTSSHGGTPPVSVSAPTFSGALSTRSTRSMSFRQFTGSIRRLSSAKNQSIGQFTDPATCYGGLTATAPPPPPDIMAAPSTNGLSHQNSSSRASPRNARKLGPPDGYVPASPYDSTPPTPSHSSPRKVNEKIDFRDTLNMVQFARLVAVVAEKYFKSDGSKKSQRSSLTPATFHQPPLLPPSAGAGAGPGQSHACLRAPHHHHSLSHDNLSFRPYPQNMYPHKEAPHAHLNGHAPVQNHVGSYHAFTRRQAVLSAMAQGPDAPHRGSNNGVDHGMNGYHQQHSKSTDPLAEIMPSKFLSKNPSIHRDQAHQTLPPQHNATNKGRSPRAGGPNRHQSSHRSAYMNGATSHHSPHHHHQQQQQQGGIGLSPNHLAPAMPSGLPQKFFQRNPSFNDVGDSHHGRSISCDPSSDSMFLSGSRSAGSSPPRGYTPIDERADLADDVRTSSSPFPVPHRAKTSPNAHDPYAHHPYAHHQAHAGKAHAHRDPRSSSPLPSASSRTSPFFEPENPLGVHTVPMPARTYNNESDNGDYQDSSSGGNPFRTHTVPAPRPQRPPHAHPAGPSPSAMAHRRIMSAGLIGGFGGGRLALQRDRAIGRSSFLMEGDPMLPDRQGLSRSPPLDRKRGRHSRSPSTASQSSRVNALTDHEVELHISMKRLDKKRSLVSEPSSLRKRFNRVLGRSPPSAVEAFQASSSSIDTTSSSSNGTPSRSQMAKMSSPMAKGSHEQSSSPSRLPTPGMRNRKQLMGNRSRIRELSPSRGRAQTDAHAREREWQQYANASGGGGGYGYNASGGFGAPGPGPVPAVPDYSNSDSDSDVSISSSLSRGSRSRSYSNDYGVANADGCRSRERSPEPSRNRTAASNRDRAESDESNRMQLRPNLATGGNLMPGGRGRIPRHTRAKTDIRPALTDNPIELNARRVRAAAHSRHISHGAGTFLGGGGGGAGKRPQSLMTPPPMVQRSASDFGGIIPPGISSRPSFSKPMAPKQAFEKARQKARKNHARENSMTDGIPDKAALHPKMFMPPSIESLSRPTPQTLSLDRRKPKPARDEYAILKEGIRLKKYNNRGRGQGRFVWFDEALTAIRWAKNDRRRHKELNFLYSDNMLCIETGCKHAKLSEKDRSLTIVGMARELYLCFPTVQSRNRWETALNSLVVLTSLKRSNEPKERGRAKSRKDQLKRSRTTPVHPTASTGSKSRGSWRR